MRARPGHVYFVFVDGFGLGNPDPVHNPLLDPALSTLRYLNGDRPLLRDQAPVVRPDHTSRPIDACLGVPGLPQSGTGQAALLTGVNAPLLAGRHFGPFPHSKTRQVLATHNLFRRIRTSFPNHPEPAAFANAYPPRFFEVMSQRDRWTVTTRCCLDAGIRIRTARDLASGDALAADLTARGWSALGIDVPPITEREAGNRLVEIGRKHVVTLFEYFLTDKAGHHRSMEEASAALHALDAFLAGVLQRMDPAHELLILCSDHGNVEDLSVRTHTTNPVPLIAFGAGAAGFGAVMDLTGVSPAIVAGVTTE